MSHLRYLVNGIAPDTAVWPELRQAPVPRIDEGRLSELSVGSLNGWVLRTCYHLREAGNSVTLSKELKPDAINLVAPSALRRRHRRLDCFVVIARADSYRPMLADYVLVQGAAAETGPLTSYIPYWPQPNIRPRDHESRTGITRLGFKGRINHLDPEYRSQDFVDALSALGVELALDGFEGILGSHDWGDYRDLDLILAARNMAVQKAVHKPASKLVNAWFGEVPALLGPEPSFRALRRRPEDYIDVRTPQDVLTAIARLRENPGLYWSIVQNGVERRKDFTVDALQTRWTDLINDEIGPVYDAWQRQPRLKTLTDWMGMMIGDPVARWFHRHRIKTGARISEL